MTTKVNRTFVFRSFVYLFWCFYDARHIVKYTRIDILCECNNTCTIPNEWQLQGNYDRVLLESTYFQHNFELFYLLLGFIRGSMLKVKDFKTSLPNNEQSQRKLTLRRHCSSFPRNILTKLTLKDSIYSNKHQVVYCPVPKVATSNWKRIFQTLEGYAANPMEISKGVVHELNFSTFKI